MEVLEDLITIMFLWNILKWLVIVLILVIVLYFVIRTICKYQAKKNAEAFNYDYLAERTAEEVCKRLVIIERQKATAYKGATGSAGVSEAPGQGVVTNQEQPAQ